MNTTKPTGRGYYTRKPKTYVVPEEDRIDEAETLLRFGYSATAVCPSGNKKVVCRCEKCENLIERIRMRVHPPVLCHSCVKAKINLGPIEGLVDVEATQQQLHYGVKNLPRHSNQKVVGICSTCQKRYLVRLSSVQQGQQCRSCLRKGICDAQWAPREKDGREQLNEKETLKQFGYSALDLSPKSNQMVIANCSFCGDSYQRIRRNIKDTSECIPCARRRIDHRLLQDKRNQTLREHFPAGIPQPDNYGQAANLLGEYLEGILGRSLLREKSLANGQRLDLFDTQTKTGIEYCGLFWHNEHSLTPRGKYYHADKMKAAQKEGYRLITVFEDEYLIREEAVKNRLLVILGNKRTTIPARKCTLSSVEAIAAKTFLDRYHTQGSPAVFKYAFGLFYAENLVGLILGGVHHRQGHKSILVLSRLCFAPQVHITGGSQRLFKRLCDQGKLDGYSRLITWADKRWTDGAVYSRLGMTLTANLLPDYSYVKTAKPRERFSKQSQKKSRTGCPPEMTEKDWALQRGFSRIWDCGHQRWEYDLLP